MCNVKVFDFDYTIYNGDSTIDFYLFCLRKYPIFVKYIPKQVYIGIRYYLKRETVTNFKTQFLWFLKDIQNVEQEVLVFWEVYHKKIKPWYNLRDKNKDIIISASPHFLLEPICRELGVQYLIATEIDTHTVQFLTPNCKGEEKVRRFKEQFGELKIKEFYSDSQSDLPLARLAEKSYLVKNNKITQWEIEDTSLFKGKNQPLG